jgi:hypothetical protein
MALRSFRSLFVAVITIVVLSTVSVGTLWAQKSDVSPVPRVIRFSGTVLDASGKPQIGVVGAAFAIYSEQTGGAPLWVETQNVELDVRGHYTVLLGAGKPDGLPSDLFNSGEARWLGVQAQVAGAPEQTRVLLVSVPYAMKAGDAETLGGKPLSSFVLTESIATKSQRITDGSKANRESTAAINNGSSNGTPNRIAKFDSASTVIDSAIYENGGKVGIGTTTPTGTLSVVNDATADSTASAAVNITSNNGSSNGRSTLAVTSNGGSDPLILANKNFVGDSGQWVNVLSATNTGTFTPGALGTQSISVTTEIPASNTVPIAGGGILGYASWTSNLGTGHIRTITGLESDSSSAAGSSDIVEGGEMSAENAGSSVSMLRGFSAMIFNTAGTTTDGVGIHIQTPVGTGTLTNDYGLKIESQASGTNNWAIKTDAGLVQFGDKTLLAPSTANAASLNIPAGSAPSTPAPGDLWSNGTNLIYHSSTGNRAIAFTDSLIFSNGTSVGIGTMTPTKTLEVNGTIRANNTISASQSSTGGDAILGVDSGDTGGNGVHGKTSGNGASSGVWGESVSQVINAAGVYGSTEGPGMAGWFEAYPNDSSANSTALLARSYGENTVPAVFNNTSGGKILSLQSGYSDTDPANSPEVLSVISNGNLTTIGSVTASSFYGNGAGLTNIPATAISGNLNATSGGTGVTSFGSGLVLKSTAANTWSAQALQVSDLPAAANYVFATDHTGPFVQLTGGLNPTFTPVTFDTNVKIDNWTHTPGESDFVANQSGAYLVQYSAGFYTSPASPDPASGIEIQAVRTTPSASAMIPDSNVAAYNLNPSLTNVSKSFIVDMTAGDSLKLQWAELFENEIACISSSQPATNPIISMTITRIQ